MQQVECLSLLQVLLKVGLVNIGNGVVSNLDLGLSVDAATTTANAITGGTLFGASTSLFGVNMPVITNKFNTFFSTILSGDFFKSNEHEQSS